MLLKRPEVNNNDSTWVRLKFFLCKKERLERKKKKKKWLPFLLPIKEKLASGMKQQPGICSAFPLCYNRNVFKI